MATDETKMPAGKMAEPAKGKRKLGEMPHGEMEHGAPRPAEPAPAKAAAAKAPAARRRSTLAAKPAAKQKGGGS